MDGTPGIPGRGRGDANLLGDFPLLARYMLRRTGQGSSMNTWHHLFSGKTRGDCHHFLEQTQLLNRQDGDAYYNQIMVNMAYGPLSFEGSFCP